MNPLHRSLLATLSYYDLLDYPLTALELWRLLARGPGAERVRPGEVFAALADGGLSGRIGTQQGFYFLLGREELVPRRLWRKKLADRKWKKLGRTFRLLSSVPFVRGIFMSGSLAMENSKPDSDVDVIVVARHGRIWTVRTLMTLMTALLGVRRHGRKTRDRICLNHYITDRSLSIPFHSLYNAESYAHLVNVYAGDEPLFARFEKENTWLEDYLIDWKSRELASVRSLEKGRPLSLVARIGELALGGALGRRLEAMFARFQGNRIRRDPLYGKAGGRVTIDDGQLEFHPDSHERYIIPEFNRRMEALGLREFAGQKDSGLNR